MNWNAISAVGDIVGAIGVVISLIYLAKQIKDQNSQSKLSSLFEMSRELRVAQENFATKEFADIFIRANQDFNSITESESLRLFLLVTNLFRIWENTFLEHKDGNLSDKVWVTLSKDYSQAMGIPSFKYIWAMRKQNYDEDFQHYVDSLKPIKYIYQ